MLQQQTEKLEKFLDAVHQSSVSKLADDAGVLIPLLRATTAPVAKVKHSLETVNSKQRLVLLNFKLDLFPKLNTLVVINYIKFDDNACPIDSNQFHHTVITKAFQLFFVLGS